MSDPMMASDLIEELEALIDKHGDCVVTDNGSDRAFNEIRAYDENGMCDGRAVEFSLIRQ